MTRTSLKSSFLLFITALIWGTAFVAQSVGMDHVGPFTFLCTRSLLGGLVLVPLVVCRRRAARAADPAEAKRSDRALLPGGLACGCLLFVASSLQQFGIMQTTVGKAGFLTALYILIVPLLGLFAGRRVGARVWLGVALALAGLYLLCMRDSFALGRGDVLLLLGAVGFSLHILVIDHFSPQTDGVQMACIQFFTCGALAGLAMLLFEQPSLAALAGAWAPVLYAGVLSSGVGYTLQIVGQRNMDPTVASLILSLESVNSAWAGWLLLGQTLSLRELSGCALMFAAIILAQLPGKKAAQTQTKEEASCTTN